MFWLAELMVMVALTGGLYALVAVSRIPFPFDTEARAQARSKWLIFKCTLCGKVEKISIRQLQKMQKPDEMSPMMGPMKLECPKCHKKELTQGVECPACQEKFVMKLDPAKGRYDDRCPKCGKSYAEAWRDMYRNEK